MEYASFKDYGESELVMEDIEGYGYFHAPECPYGHADGQDDICKDCECSDDWLSQQKGGQVVLTQRSPEYKAMMSTIKGRKLIKGIK